jgi:hypothetical protein
MLLTPLPRPALPAVCYALGFAFFVLPEIFVGWYWFFHSLWHVMIGIAYYELYQQLEQQDSLAATKASG